MIKQVVVPMLGESVVEATVAEWLKHEGDAVLAGEALVRLETDKVDLEVTAEVAGTLQRIERGAGQDVKIGDVLGIIASAEDAADAAAPTTAEPAAASRAPEERVTPVARRMAQEEGVDLTQVVGSGPSGRVTRRDVEGFLAQQKAAEAPAAPPAVSPAPAAVTPPTARPAAVTPAPVAPPTAVSAATPALGAASPAEDRIRMTRRRQTIARRLVEAQQTAAMLTTFNEIDMSAVMEIRARRKESFRERHGIGLGFMSFFVKACIGALKAFPLLNAEIQGDEIVVKRYYDIGVAIGAREGLVVPVLRGADQMSFAAIERAIKEFAQKTEANTLTLEDLRGGSFTITNGGVFGSLLSTPILNPPQVAILGMHKIEPRPVAVDGQVVIRPMMYVALSYDHRIVDGREAVQFLVKVKELIEDPEALLLEG